MATKYKPNVNANLDILKKKSLNAVYFSVYFWTLDVSTTNKENSAYTKH